MVFEIDSLSYKSTIKYSYKFKTPWNIPTIHKQVIGQLGPKYCEDSETKEATRCCMCNLMRLIKDGYRDFGGENLLKMAIWKPVVRLDNLDMLYTKWRINFRFLQRYEISIISHVLA
jgi:hypothetical protein